MRGKPRARSGWRAAMVAGVIAMGVSPGAHAQSSGSETHPGQAGSGMDGQVTGAGSGSANGASGNNKMDTSQGVAGTGMGTMMPKKNAPGTGNSVQGPPGQGVTNGQGMSNSTDTAK